MTQGKTTEIKPAKGRPMLTWVGKRPLRRVTAYPAQHIETFDPEGSLGKKPADPEIWKDWPKGYPKGGLLFHGDNKEVLAHLLANGFRGKVNLVYIDPPFDSGADYVRKVSLRGPKGTAKLGGETYTLGEQIQYTDIWANDNYLQFMYERLLLLRELLHSTGTLIVHCDTKRAHHFRCLVDEVMGSNAFRNELVWFYENKLGTGGQTFDKRHDSLLLFTRSDTWTHNDLLVPVKKVKKQPVTQKIDGKRVWLRDEDGKRIYQESASERPLGDVWPVPIVNPVGDERLGYPTQKPLPLLEMVVRAASKRGDLVMDCFQGSGPALVAAQKLGRRWIGCDINKGAIQTSAIERPILHLTLRGSREKLSSCEERIAASSRWKLARSFAGRCWRCGARARPEKRSAGSRGTREATARRWRGSSRPSPELRRSGIAVAARQGQVGS